MTPHPRLALPLWLLLAASLASIASPAPVRAGEARADTMLALETRSETLANGLDVVLVKGEPGSGGALLTTFPAGEASLPPDKRGVATLVAAGLAGGSSARPAAAFDAALAQLGARLETRATADAVEVAVVAPPESLAAAAQLLAELLAAPALPESLVAAERARLAAQVDAAPDVDALARALLVRILLDRHPYAFGPTTESIAGIQPGDLHAFVRRSMGAAGATLVVAGAFADDDALLRAIRPAFARLPDGPARPRDRVLIPPQTRRRVYLVHRAGEAQSAVAVGNSGMRSGDPDLPNGLLVERALGGPSGGRVPSALAEGRLASRASVTLDARRDAGLVVASALAEPAAIDSATVVLIDALERVRHEPLLAHEVEDAAAALAAEHAARTREALGLARETAEVLAAPRDPSWTRRFDSMVRTASTLEIARVARRLVRPYTAPLVFAGDGVLLAPRIARFGEILWFDEHGEPIPRAAIPAPAAPAAPPAADSARAPGAPADAAMDSAAADSAPPVPTEPAPRPAADSAPRAPAEPAPEAPVVPTSSPFDISPFRDGEDASYAVLFDDKEIAHLDVRVGPDEWDERPVIAVHARLSGLVGQEISLAFRAEDFAPISCQLSRAGDSVATDAAFHYGEGRVRGRVALAGGGERAIDADVPEGTIDAGMIPYAIRALPLDEGARHDISTFGPQTGTVSLAHIAVGDLAEVILPSDSVMARRVEVTGSEAAGTYFVADTPSRTIVMFTTAMSGLTFVLTP